MQLDTRSTRPDFDAVMSYAAHGVAVDSRTIKPGQLFFALKGEKTDGHSYLGEVISRRATAAVVSSSYRGQDHGLTLLRVDDPLKTLQQLAKQVLSQRKSQIVAVTGSVGKTTTKEFLRTLLIQKFRVFASPGNQNSQVGLPLAILNHTTGQEEILVLEMGMTHAGNIAELIQIAPPDVAVITHVSLVHAINFTSLIDIARAKGEIFLHPKTKLGILSADIDACELLKGMGSCQKRSFSTERQTADYFLQQSGTALTFRYPGGETLLPPLPVPGAHNLHNFLSAISVAHYFGVSGAEMAAATAKIQLPERRLQQIERQGVLFINDSYNACEESMKAALRCLPAPKQGGRRIAVLGLMVELGIFSEQSHREVGKASLATVDAVICLGEECRPIWEEWQAAKRPVIWCKTREEVVAALKKQLQPGDVVLLKGSNRNGLWHVLDAFSEEQ